MHAPVPDLRTYPLATGIARSVDLFSILAAGLSFALYLVVALVVLRDFPNSADEYGYLFGAETYLKGRLYLDAIPFDEFFGVTYVFSIGDKLVSQYPPGWPGFLAAVKLLGMPFVVAGPLAGAATLLATGGLARAALDERAARVAMVLVAAAPFFVFNAASYFNHMWTALWLVVFALAARRLLDEPSAAAAALLGFAISMAGITRYYSALLAVIPFAVAFLSSGRRAPWRLVPVALAGAAPLAGFLLYYNWRITGDPLLTVTAWGFPYLKLGLWGYGIEGPNSPTRALSIALARVLELGEWTSPVFLLLWAAAFIAAIRRRTAQFTDLMLPIFILGYMLYPDEGGNRYGPRYWFEAFPFMTVTVAALVTEFASRYEERRRSVLLHLTAVHLIICAVTLPLLSRFEYEVVTSRLDLYDAVDRAGLHQAIVIVRSGTSELRPMEPGDLTRNGLTFGGDVLYARDQDIDNHRLRDAFPDREIWAYEREPTERYGRLLPLRY
jgi:hypothetical protein